jgi:hypothetical protein
LTFGNKKIYFWSLLAYRSDRTLTILGQKYFGHVIHQNASTLNQNYENAKNIAFLVQKSRLFITLKISKFCSIFKKLKNWPIFKFLQKSSFISLVSTCYILNHIYFSFPTRIYQNLWNLTKVFLTFSCLTFPKTAHIKNCLSPNFYVKFHKFW